MKCISFRFHGGEYSGFHHGKWHALDGFLEKFWGLTNGDVSKAWMLRPFAAFLLSIQVLCIYRIATYFSCPPKEYLYAIIIKIVIALSIVTIINSYRGYEIRPEIFPNTAILFSAALIAKLQHVKLLSISNFFQILLACLLLTIGGSMSFRHTLPSLLVTIPLLLVVHRSTNYSRSRLLTLLVICGLMAAYINFSLNDILALLKISINRPNLQSIEYFNRLSRLEMGHGGIWAMLIRLALASYPLYIFIMLIKQLGIKKFTQTHITFMFITFALLSYYFFLLIFDTAPYEYVKSIEWTLITVAVFFAYSVGSDLTNNGTALKNLFSIISLLILLTFLMSTHELIKNKNSIKHLMGLSRSHSYQEVFMMTNRGVAAIMFNDSILDQLRSRAVYCSRHPNGIALIHYFTSSPICLRDGGSVYYSGFRGFIDPNLINFEIFDFLIMPVNSMPPKTIDRTKMIFINGAWINVEDIERQIK